MENRRVYIQAASQVSIQEPLSEEWMNDPKTYTQQNVGAIDPQFRDFLPANDARRMGKIMKRALITAIKVINDSGIKNPEAIITGTGKGCLEYTEKFLDDMVENNEQMLSPTFFMQSTHNTIGSTLGIYTKTHSYNVTYSHGGFSFDQALLDAWIQIKTYRINNALIGGYDEMVESYFNLLRRAEYVGLEGMVPCGEVAMSMIVGTKVNDTTLCEISGIKIFNNIHINCLKIEIEQMLSSANMTFEDICAIMTGVNGRQDNDEYYKIVTSHLFGGVPILQYKNIFGENYTSSALGIYASAHCLYRRIIPDFLFFDGNDCKIKEKKCMIFLNHTRNNDCSIILLKKI